MSGDRPDGSLSDPALDREIEHALAVDPSPEFVARMRARVAHDSDPETGWLTWMLAGAGACVAAIVLASATWLAPRDTASGQSEPPAISTARVEPQPGALQVESRAATTAERSASVRGGPSEAVTVKRVEPVVVIAEEEARALDQLFRDVSAGRVDVSVWPNGSSTAEPLMPIREIAIDPIDVGSLTPIGE